MGAKKLIGAITDFLNLKDFKISSKKRALKELLKKLKERRVAILHSLKEECEEQRSQELKEELKLLTLHIKKAKEKIELL